jgi:DNA-binding PadR family transcriptional regulator
MPISEGERHLQHSQEALFEAFPALQEGMQDIEAARRLVEEGDLGQHLDEALTLLNGLAQAVPQYAASLNRYISGIDEDTEQTASEVPSVPGPDRSAETSAVRSENPRASYILLEKQTLSAIMTAKTTVSDYLRRHGKRPRTKGVSLDEIAVLYGIAQILESAGSTYAYQVGRDTGLSDSLVSTILNRLHEDGVLETKIGSITPNTGRPRRDFALTSLGRAVTRLLPEEWPASLIPAKARVSAILQAEGAQVRSKGRGVRLDEVVILHDLAHHTEFRHGFSGVQIAEDLASDVQATTATLRTFEKDGILESEMEQLDPATARTRGARRIFKLTELGRKVLRALKDEEQSGQAVE